MRAGHGREALLAQHHRSVLEPAQQLLTGGPAVGLDVLQLHGRGLGAVLEAELSRAIETGLATDAAIARSSAQAADFWRLRESVPAAQTRAGGSLKHDVSIPVASMPAFIERGAALVAELAPEGYLVSYGHVGDGNLHFNLNQREGAELGAFLARELPLKRAIHDLVAEMRGSFSAEHGIGRLKVGELERYAQPEELAMMRRIKQAFDPKGILNPGKVLRSDRG